MKINYSGGFALAVFLLPSVSLAEVFKYECTYPKVFSEGSGYKDSKFSLEFRFDTTTGEAFVVGNNGLSSVKAYAGEKGITFLELLSSGAVQSTTITALGKSVHSRHSIMGNLLIPSQAYGSCEFSSEGKGS